MGDRPIIFSAPMVRALMEGRKTQTRRVLQPPKWAAEPFEIEDSGNPYAAIAADTGCFANLRLPYAPGDRLYVREAWYAAYGADDVAPRNMDATWKICAREAWDYAGWGLHGKLRSSIHMPRWASRLTLAVTEVRVQRLQDINSDDAYAEGIETDLWDQAPVARRYGTDGWFVAWPGMKEPSVSVEPEELYQLSYASLWNSLHGPGAWDANPWIVAVTFTVQQRNIGHDPH